MYNIIRPIYADDKIAVYSVQYVQINKRSQQATINAFFVGARGGGGICNLAAFDNNQSEGLQFFVFFLIS